jgi:hypothetical protein
MKYSGLAALFLGIVCLCPVSTAASAVPDIDKPPEQSPAEDIVVIIGQVVIYGSEPHTFAGIDSENGKTYAVYPKEKEREMWSLQGRRIEFTVRFLDNPQGEGSLYLRDGTVTPLSWWIINDK